LCVLQAEAEAEEALARKLLAAARWETAVRWEQALPCGTGPKGGGVAAGLAADRAAADRAAAKVRIYRRSALKNTPCIRF
jgi:hypothetical protein